MMLIRNLALLLVALAATWVLAEAALLLRDARRDEARLANETETLITTAQRASDAAFAAETKQLVTLDRTSAEFYKLTAAARLVLVRTDRSLNDDVAPRLGRTIDSYSELARRSSADIDGMAQQATSAFTATNGLLSNAASLVSDPAIRETLVHLDKGTADLADSSKQLDATMIDLRQVSDKARETYLKPANLWWAVIKQLLPLAGSAAQVVK